MRVTQAGMDDLNQHNHMYVVVYKGKRGRAFEIMIELRERWEHQIAELKAAAIDMPYDEEEEDEEEEEETEYGQAGGYSSRFRTNPQRPGYSGASGYSGDPGYSGAPAYSGHPRPKRQILPPHARDYFMGARPIPTANFSPDTESGQAPLPPVPAPQQLAPKTKGRRQSGTIFTTVPQPTESQPTVPTVTQPTVPTVPDPAVNAALQNIWETLQKMS